MRIQILIRIQGLQNADPNPGTPRIRIKYGSGSETLLNKEKMGKVRTCLSRMSPKGVSQHPITLNCSATLKSSPESPNTLKTLPLLIKCFRLTKSVLISMRIRNPDPGCIIMKEEKKVYTRTGKLTIINLL